MSPNYPFLSSMERTTIDGVPNEGANKLKKKDKKALYYIHQGMCDETFQLIEGAKSSYDAWSILATSYKGDDKIKRVRLQTLRHQYELLQMESNEEINTYVNRVLTLANDMKTNGETLLEQNKVEKIMRTLSPRFEHVVTAIEEAKDLSTMTIKLLSSSLRAHKQRMNDNKSEKTVEQALQAQVSVGDANCDSGNSQGRGRGRGGNHQGGHNGRGFNSGRTSHQNPHSSRGKRMLNATTATREAIMQMNFWPKMKKLPIMHRKLTTQMKLKVIMLS
ncbi:uncharacterized protein LOC125369794 [Ricinus communis]|uniref:uncharacterized protein LOC125369794 n=1 Tax=Ricinus communis TaxID=3988 RepID=UPI00201ADA1F|nr:uncharacterized protein LOC125369794 [Ricinus communis]